MYERIGEERKGSKKINVNLVCNTYKSVHLQNREGSLKALRERHDQICQEYSLCAAVDGNILVRT
jgi:hypothetical protein